jgi:ketosteroid isomerase-like protein
MGRVAYVALLLIAVSCRQQEGRSDNTELLNTDRAWSQVASAGRDVDSVVAFWSDDARVAMPGAPQLKGKAAVKQMVASSFATPGFHITWTPDNAVIAASGDLGYTTGTNEMSIPDSTGKVTRITGRYITVWRKDANGRWRCVEDYSTPGPASTKSTA